jgi:hypothetical protein
MAKHYKIRKFALPYGRVFILCNNFMQPNIKTPKFSIKSLYLKFFRYNKIAFLKD